MLCFLKPLPAEKAVHVSEHVRPQPYNQVVDHELQQQQCIHPPLGQNRQCDDVLSKEEESEPIHVHTLIIHLLYVYYD